MDAAAKVAGAPSQPIQHYDLTSDIGETNNLSAQMPERVEQRQALLENLVVRGRSTPGPDQKNDVEVRRFHLQINENRIREKMK